MGGGGLSTPWWVGRGGGRTHQCAVMTQCISVRQIPCAFNKLSVSYRARMTGPPVLHHVTARHCLILNISTPTKALDSCLTCPVQPHQTLPPPHPPIPPPPQTEEEAYLDLLPWQWLASSNQNFLITERRRHYLRYAGALTFFEINGPSVYKVGGLSRLDSLTQPFVSGGLKLWHAAGSCM
jgi:hypothetical protein